MRRLLFPLVLLAFIAAACSGDGVDDGGGGGGTSPQGGLSGLLALIPDEGSASTFVTVNDLGRAAEEAGLDRPASGAEDDELADWFIGLTADQETGVGAAPFGSYAQTVIEDDAWREELGFGLVDVDADIVAGGAPDEYQAFVGDFDGDTVEAAVESDPTWSDELETVDYEGLTYFSWGEDDDTGPERITPVRRIGESLRLFVDDDAGVAYLANSTAVMEQSLDAFRGEAATLADDNLLGPMAAALDDAGAHSAILSDDQEAIELFASSGPGLAAYDAFATGATLVDGEPNLVIVLSSPDEATAEENVDRLEAVVAEGESASTREAWADLLGSGTVEADGTLTIGTFPTDDIRLWATAVFQRDSLLGVG